MKIENIKIEKPQDFEWIYSEIQDFDERRKLLEIEIVNDFETLENVFITELNLEDPRMALRAFDKLEELYKEDKRFKKMNMLVQETHGFRGWTPFGIDHLRANNNIDSGIRWVLYQGYKFYRYDRTGGNFEYHRGRIISDIIDACILPVKINNKIEMRIGLYSVQFHYKIIIKVLQQDENGLHHDYLYCEAWNILEDAHDKYHFEKCWT